MPTEVIDQKPLPPARVKSDSAQHDPRAGLTSDVDALLTVFDSIEAAVAADAAIAGSAAKQHGDGDDAFVVAPLEKATGKKPR